MPTTMLKGVGLADTCALVTDGRYSGAASGLSIGHVSPEAAAKGALALVEEGHGIEIDIPGRSIPSTSATPGWPGVAWRWTPIRKAGGRGAGRVRFPRP